MAKPCCGGNAPDKTDATCNATEPACGSDHTPAPNGNPLEWFGQMIDHCYDYACAQRDAGRLIVGIMCEYAPRELILAAGAVPVCLCGGSADTIPAAEAELPANLCPLIKSTYGFHVEKANPFLEMASMIVAETTCDGKKKMFELMGESRPTYLMELPQKEGCADALASWRRELDKFRAALAERLQADIPDEEIRKAARAMNRERRLRRQLAALMKADAPPLTGLELLTLKSSIAAIPADFEQYEKALEWLPARPGPPCTASRVRVLLTGVPVVHGAERVMEIVEGAGGLVVCMENCTGLKPILDDVDESADDIMQALAEKYFRLPCSVKTPNEARFESLRALAQEYRAECVIDLVWQACLTYDVESHRVKRLAKDVLGLPFLSIQTDYSPSDSARIAVRVEALFETARNARANACAERQ